MDNIEAAETAVLKSISGFHEYIFDGTAHVVSVGQNLCDMTGYTEQELVSDKSDLYLNLVHPADRAQYAEFIGKFYGKEQTLSSEYRIVCKDGAVKYVKDTVTSARTVDGILIGVSTLCDITALKTENDNLRFLNETIPCGFLKYTCDKMPKVTYVNEQMLNILRFPSAKKGEIDYRELYSDNIYLMIPMEERRKFAHFLKRVYVQGTPVAGELSVVRCDGTKATLYGWVTKIVNEQGNEEFQSVCMDITERYKAKKVGEIERYVKALSDVYDKIFEYDFSNKTVKYLYGNKSDTFGRIQNIPMHLEEATKRWLSSTVVKEDLDRVMKFFDAMIAGNHRTEKNKPPQIRYRAMSSSGMIKTYIGIFLKIDESVSFYCCKAVEDTAVADILRTENLSLKNMNENMQEIVMRFTEGIMAFEVSGDGTRVTPMYASENVCRFFGYTPEEWMPMTQQSIEISEFVSKSGIDFEEFAGLLDSGEAEFSYVDTSNGRSRRIKAVCSEKKSDGASPRYVMLYNMDSSDGSRQKSERKRVYIRTFGYFDVFIDDQPVAFRNKKSKELLALLVDRRGGYVTSEEAIGFLWEDEPANAVTLARYRKVALRLKNILEEYGITDIVETVDGKRRIVTDKISCDLYDYMSGAEEFSGLFKGSYLTNYSWSEITLGELTNKM